MKNTPHSGPKKAKRAIMSDSDLLSLLPKEYTISDKSEQNDIITISYRNLKFEIDVLPGDVILVCDDLYDLVSQDNIETMSLNLFLSRIVKNHKKYTIKL